MSVPAGTVPVVPGPSALRLGILHLGRPESGVRRYARIITDELARRPDVRLTQTDAGLLEGRRGGLGSHGRLFADRDVDALWLQWNKRGWGKGPRAAYRFLDLRREWRGPLVVTLHDVFDRATPKERWLDADSWSLRLVARAADRLVVHSEVEVERLAGIALASRIRVVPHFVEERRVPLSAEAARAHLGLGDQRIVTLLGFIYGRKGHADLVEAVPHLPTDVRLVFAGGSVAGKEGLLRRVRGRLEEMGATDRVTITGYLSEEDMETWMAATHLAALPFRDLSASGSLSSWIAAGKPILASDLPGFHEYDRLVPGSIRFIDALDPATLAACIVRTLESGRADPDPAIVELREHLTVPVTADRYLQVIREAVRES
jgi:glycosyltransferase involved in cell wall biosynthesis